jgi:uncharacterized OB-fold protein
MSGNRFEKVPSGAAAKRYFYQKCKHCGAAAHIDSVYCVVCKKRVKDVCEITPLYETDAEPEAGRMNLDHA